MFKKYFLLLLFFPPLVICAQNKRDILTHLKLKHIDSLMIYCDYPFDFSAGSMIDDVAVKTPQILKGKFSRLFKEKYFDDFFTAKKKVTEKGNTIIFETRNFNKEGELESESTIIFNFRLGKDKKLKLYQISLAG